jgi:hypothetical protein
MEKLFREKHLSECNKSYVVISDSSNIISFYLYNFNIEWKSGLSVKTCFTAEWRPDGCRLYCILQVHKNFPNFDGINPSSQYLLK